MHKSEWLFISRAILLILIYVLKVNNAFLYPRDSETRDHKSLDGIWNFAVPPKNHLTLGTDDFWQLQDLSLLDSSILMPVPSSFNDITQDANLRDYVGPVWYDRTFFIPLAWNNTETRVWLRFGSVHYKAQVWVNGEVAMTHEIGHLPFQADITQFLQFGGNNKVTVSVDNRLWTTSVPYGTIRNTSTDNGYVLIQDYPFDFFNYAGIHRPVVLYTTPRVYIDDITTQVTLQNGTAIIHYEIQTSGYYEDETPPACQVFLLDKTYAYVGYTANIQTNDSCKGNLIVSQPNLWWPYLMHANPGYLYQLEVKLIDFDINNDIEPVPLDVYRLPIGIRTLRWTNTSFLINEKPVYLRGFGRHEDSDIRGKGLDLPLVTRDYNLIKWIGANAYRTSHYPYAEEIMDFADQTGIMIIDESPSVDSQNFINEVLEKHKRSMTELIQRDKNRPSVIAWSLSNEPRCSDTEADSYFGSVAAHARSLDTTRPLTISISISCSSDKAGKYLDIISFNRYNGWYSNAGRTDMIINNLINEARCWHNRYNKSVMLSEYGASTVEGLHFSPAFVWSEEYQTDLMNNHFKAFDLLRKEGFFIGEFIWNFADFKTKQDYTRVGGNKKGIFTRNRQPKASAHLLRQRYFVLANILDNVTLPNDLFRYIALNNHDEL